MSSPGKKHTAKVAPKKPAPAKPKTFVEQMSQIRGSASAKKEALTEAKAKAHEKTRLTGKAIVRPKADAEGTNFSQKKKAQAPEISDPFEAPKVTFAQQMKYRNRIK